MYICSKCNSDNVVTIEHAVFDPNNGYNFVEACDEHVMDWCIECDGETTFKEVETPP